MKTKNIALNCKKKAQRWWIVSIIVFAFITVMFQYIATNPDKQSVFVASSVLGIVLGLATGLLYMSLAYQPALRKQRNILDGRFRHYFESCLKHINKGNIEKAEHYYDNGLRFYTHGGYNNRQMFLRGAIRQLSGKIKQCNFDKL